MRIVYNLISIFTFAARRLWHNLGLMVGTAVGIIAAVALVVSVPVFADGVNFRLMSRALQQQQQGAQRPPYAFMFRYVGGWYGAVDYPAYQKADQFLSNEAASQLNLPLDLGIRYVKSDNVRVFPAGASNYSDAKQMLDRLAIGFISGLPDHIRILEGRFPNPQSATDTTPLEVLVTEAKATELGLQVGEAFTTIGETGNKNVDIGQITVKVVGIWRARSPDDTFWFYNPTAFDSTFLTTEESFVNRVVPQAKTPVYLALWYLIFDGRHLHTEDVPGFMGRVTTVATLADKALPKTSLDISPMDALWVYVAATQLLTILMFVFAIPIIGLVLYFVVLTTNLVVQRQRNEIAVLRSRGMSVLQVVAVYLLEGLILGGIALIIGPLLGEAIAYLMGAARSYLTFSTASPLLIRLSQQTMRLAIASVGIMLLSSTLPAIAAARHTIVSYKQDVARSMEKPWWQKIYLDVILLIIPLYGYYLLQQRGTISLLGRSISAKEGDPFQNPLLFLVPTLFVFALALLFVRVFPVLMGILARLFDILPGIALVLALRQLSRSWGQFAGPLLLIVLTMGLACFTGSMAKTLDAGLTDQSYYDVGADLRLTELGDAQQLASATDTTAVSSNPDTTASNAPVIWNFVPVSEHLRVNGVEGAARLANFGADVRLGQSEVKGQIIGIDRLDFLRTGFYRPDFSPESLGKLVNDLAKDESAVLVPVSVLGTFGLGIGDTFTLQIVRDRSTTDVPLTIAGVIDLWPTTYPDQGTIFVANLDYLFQQMGGEYPYDVLIKTAPGVDTTRLVSDIQDVGFRVGGVMDTQKIIDSERQRPERQGILGLLSVGTIAAALLTVLGLLFYAFVSFQRRFIELGILRAIGLSVPQMIKALGVEQFVLVVSGVIAGTAFGVVASYMFIPFLQVRGGAHSQIPPFVVQIAWSDMIKVYALFGILLLLTVAGLIWLLLRMRISEAVKLGEAV